jgi:hypothetical protein
MNQTGGTAPIRDFFLLVIVVKGFCPRFPRDLSTIADRRSMDIRIAAER